MPYFPMFVNLEGKRIVVVGGGKVASRKVEKLLPFGAVIRVIAPRISNYLQELREQGKIEALKRKVRLRDLRDAFMVVVAVNDKLLQRRIHSYCLKTGIHCNAVDSPDFCSFIFPALVTRGELVVGISTSGRVPALSAGVKSLIEDFLPQDLGLLLEELQALRQSLPAGSERQERLSQIVRLRLGL